MSASKAQEQWVDDQLHSIMGTLTTSLDTVRFGAWFRVRVVCMRMSLLSASGSRKGHGERSWAATVLHAVLESLYAQSFCIALQ